MSIGNLKTDGGKGTNWPWQYKMLLGLDKIVATIKTDGKDYESDLISIKCGANPAIIRLEVRIFDTTTGAFTTIELYPPGSLVKDVTDYSACTKTYLDAGDATEATLQAILAMNTDIEANTDSIKADVGDILSNTNVLRTTTNAPTMLRATAAGVVTMAEVMKSISFYNASTTDTAQVLGANLKPGETVNFDAGGNGNKFPTNTFTYNPDATGGGAGDLLIIHVV